MGLRVGLRVGLTGGLGSGKSTIARMFAALGVYTVSADEIGRELMMPPQPVYRKIADTFGPDILRKDGTLDRKALALLAFTDGRIEELNRIVHPAVIAAQEEWMKGIFAQHPGAIAMVESALIFEVDRASANVSTNTDLKQRFDKIILVTVPEQQKIARYMARVSPGKWDASIEVDARARLAVQIPDNEKIARSDYVIQSNGTMEETEIQVRKIFHDLQRGLTEHPHL